jgi:hypothetical protein
VVIGENGFAWGFRNFENSGLGGEKGVPGVRVAFVSDLTVARSFEFPISGYHAGKSIFGDLVLLSWRYEEI